MNDRGDVIRLDAYKENVFGSPRAFGSPVVERHHISIMMRFWMLFKVYNFRNFAG